MDLKPDHDPFSSGLEASYEAMAGNTVRLARIALHGIKIFLIVFAVVAVLYYGGEDLALRLKIPRSHQVLSSMEVTRYLAIHKKNGKIEYSSEEPATVVCVNALLPHFGFVPCWYLRREADRRIDM